MGSASHAPKAANAAALAVLAAFAAAAMVAQQVVGKATRDAVFLSRFGVVALPQVVVAAAVLSLAAVLATARLLARHGPGRVLPTALVASSGLSALEWLAFERSPSLVGLALYAHMAVFGATTISTFWSLVNERFDPRTAKRYVSRIASGGTVGGVLGGVVAGSLASSIGARGMLAGMAALHAVAALAASAVRRGGGDATPHEPEGRTSASGVRVLGEVPYLRDLAAMVALLATIEVLLDWILSAQATATWGPGPPLLRFFALFHMAVGLATFLAQTLASRGALERFGVAGTIAILPGVVLVGSFVALQAARLWAAALVRGATSALGNSLYRSAYELLYTPLPLDRKRPTKTLVDVGFDRLGTALGGGIAMLVVWALPSKARWIFLLIVAVAAIAALLVASRLHEGYVRALEDSLRSGAPRLPEPKAPSISVSDVGLDRHRLLREIEALRRGNLLASGEVPSPYAWHDPTEPPASSRTVAAAVPPFVAASSPAVVSFGSASDDDGGPSGLGADLAALRAGGDRARAVLGRDAPLDRRLVPFAIELLGDDALHKHAIEALRRGVDRHVGQIVDALLSRDTPFTIRRRLPRVLAKASLQRALDGLVDALDDERFEVRYAAGLALLRITEAHSELHPPRGRLLDAARKEVETDRRLWDAEPPLDAHLDAPDDAHDEGAPFLERVLRDRTSRSLEHVFALLSLAFEREPMRLSLRALASDDPSLRGTALEYLENVLPDWIREPLWPYVGDHRPTRSVTTRPKGELVADLLRSGAVEVRAVPAPKLRR